MKKDKNLWMAKLTVIAFLCVLLVQLMTESSSVLSGLRAAMYLGVLYCGYRWGTDGGGLAGICCGLAETVRQGNAVPLGIFCLMGVLAGIFGSLGRGAAITAWLCGAIGIGMLYAKEYLSGAMPEMLTAATLFLLLPLSWSNPVKKAERKEKKHTQGKWEEMQKTRLEETADSYGKLARSLTGLETLAKGPEPMEYDEGWKGRFLESREAVSLQFREMERTLKEMAAQLDQDADISDLFVHRVRTGLRRHHIRLRHLTVLEQEGDRREAYVTVQSSRSGCVTVKEIGETVGKALSRTMRAAEGGRTIVGQEPCTIRLVEDTRYRMLSGTARVCKEEEELSGDNFSCHSLPDGRMMLCLSDGMGSGRQAFLESQLVTELMEELLDAGFAPERAIYMLNGLLLVRGEEQNPVTLDLALVDLYTGQARFYKQGAVSTFIRRGGQVIQIQPGALPMGMDCEADPAFSQIQLQDGDMVVMMTDGVLESMEGEEKEEAMSEFLSASSKNNARELAQEILNHGCAGENSVRDDMTVLTAGFWKK